jgi:hypothetical protein
MSRIRSSDKYGIESGADDNRKVIKTTHTDKKLFLRENEKLDQNADSADNGDFLKEADDAGTDSIFPTVYYDGEVYKSSVIKNNWQDINDYARS